MKIKKVESIKYKIERECNSSRFSTFYFSLSTSRGFVAIFLVMSAMIMMTLGSLGAFSAAESYDDSVARHEYRLVAIENAKSCVSVAILAFAHDYFYTSQNQIVPDFSCTIVSANRNGSSISIMASSSDNGVTESISATATDNGRSIDLLTEENL
jgi:hypothetical protein